MALTYRHLHPARVWSEERQGYVEMREIPEMTVENVWEFLDMREKISLETRKELARIFSMSEEFAGAIIEKYREEK